MLFRYRDQCESLLDTQVIANCEENPDRPIVQFFTNPHRSTSDSKREEQEKNCTYCEISESAFIQNGKKIKAEPMN
jgi:hypothetical protein